MLGALAVAALVGACGGTAPSDGAKTPVAGNEKPMLAKSAPPSGPGSSCERLTPGVGPTREGTVRQGASVALARGDKLLAYVADKDAHKLEIVDVASSKTLSRVDLLGAPEQVLVLADGRVAVSLGDGGFVDVYEPTADASRPLDHRCRITVPAGPFALAASPDDKIVAVTSAFDPSLTILDGTTLVPKKAFALPRSPRGLLLDESRAFVSHLVGAQLSVVDLSSTDSKDDRPAERKVDLRVRAGSQVADPNELALLRTGSQAFTLVSVDVTRAAAASSSGSGAPTGEGSAALQGKAPPVPNPPAFKTKSHRIVVPMVTVDPGDRARPSQFYYGPPPVAGVPKQTPIAMVVDPTAEKSLVTHVLAPTSTARREECLLPRAAAFRPSTERLYVACQGIDTVLELDARASDPMRVVIRRFDVPQSPTGIAISDKDGVAVVSSQEHGQIAKISLENGSVEFASLERGNDVANDVQNYHLGRELFYRSDDPRITGDGVACASCHPDGTEDGITWSTPEGPRQTLMLAGRLDHTAPYGWTRAKGTLNEYIQDTTQRLGGTSLSAPELEALSSYIKELPRPPISTVNVSLAEKGRQAFAERGCATCHDKSALEDAKPKNVGSKTDSDWAADFDTPSLVGVGLSAPYYHDGRYRTLDDLLADPKSKMGTVRELSGDERTSIKAYLESL